MNDPLLSIIIPHYNGAHYLTTCFNALRAQTYPHLEIILADNGSTDESVALTRRDFPEVKILELGQNLGLTGAINRAIAQSQGEVIVPLNNDTEVIPGWAQALVDALCAHPEAGMIACKMLLFDRRDTLHSAGDGFGINGIPINRGVWQKDTGQFDHDTYIFGGCGGAVAYRRAMLDDIGLFDEDLFMYLEDVDLNWRAQLAGYRVVFAPQAVVYHHLSATGGGVIASYYTGRNTLFVLAKNLPGPLFRRHWPAIVGAQFKIAVDALRAWRGEAARARLRGQLAGLWGLPKWLAKRKFVQQKKRVDEAYLENLLTSS
ncbi:MAG: glycosyltransferase family 2 protein [Anaerolineae bacterium]|nr:glycosyltransferase family 2 protein [Anaerolineales bacterium]MCQ3971920.1 glycosyltransferase family 2 protein [Anaerolineae bacterium]